MMKYTLATAAVIALLAGTAQAEQTNFDGLTVSGSLVGQGIDFIDEDDNVDDTIHSAGFGIQFDYSVNRIVGVTGGYTSTSSDDNDLDAFNLDLDTERFYSGVNLGYRFEGQDWAVKPFGVVGFNTIKTAFTKKTENKLYKESFHKVYLGAGAAVSYKQLTATLETDASILEDDVIFVESRLTLGYRF
ncbi:outer membrane beta-barrel protein [Vibrio sp. ABG19]|uniref:outer membrane beta-barrel protein n=1 Tax=Vibrio sp. ABG19 TaxID=2817385 RepID=UPI00249DAD6A|nr:outer membrane beta-barrel protein [Vibrio sp. ABG19]WGY44779.1 porin family protein [Vibrio sp. ABG19]